MHWSEKCNLTEPFIHLHLSTSMEGETMATLDVMKNWPKIVCFLLSIMLVASSVYGQSRPPTVKKLKVLGTAVIHDKNRAQARKNAVDDALTSAVGQVVSSMLTSDTMVQRFQLINYEIFSKKNSYVQNYRVLTDSISGSKIRAFVQVEVSVDQISKDLSGLGLARTGVVYPRILFMIAERNVHNENFVYWWGGSKVTSRTISEAAMVDAFKKSGFKIAGTPDLSAPLGLPMHPQDEQMVAMAKQLGADVLVTGAGTVTPVSSASGTTNTVEAIVNAKAFNVKTGQSIGQTHQKEVVSTSNETQSGNKALVTAGAVAGKELSRKVMVAWQQDRDSGSIINFMVEGTDGHIASFVRLRQTVTSLSGVRELKMKAMSADRAEMAVNYQGNSRSLSDALLLKSFEGFTIDIFDVTPDTIRIRLIH